MATGYISWEEVKLERKLAYISHPINHGYVIICYICIVKYMKIYTSYFANLKNLPETIVPISICGKAPDGYNGWQYKKLAPKWEFFKKYKETLDKDYYIKCFNEQVLNGLDPNTVIKEISVYSGGKDIALICYEKPEDFCHRHLVADWITKNTDYKVEEYNKN